jgi:hypothetical protein
MYVMPYASIIKPGEEQGVDFDLFFLASRTINATTIQGVSSYSNKLKPAMYYILHSM